jgi:hypothetical protein
MDAGFSLRLLSHITNRLDPELIFQFEENAHLDVGAALWRPPFCHLLDPLGISLYVLGRGA